jgi:hypothetical protein
MKNKVVIETMSSKRHLYYQKKVTSMLLLLSDCHPKFLLAMDTKNNISSSSRTEEAR